jgi:hypothetical protein
MPGIIKIIVTCAPMKAYGLSSLPGKFLSCSLASIIIYYTNVMFLFFILFIYISESALTIMSDIGGGIKASVEGDEASAVVFTIMALMKPLSKSKAR